MNKAPKQAPPKKSLVAPVLVIAVLVIVAALGYKGYLSSRQEPLPAPPPIADNTRSVPAPSPAQRTAEASEDAGASATSTPAPASTTPLASRPNPAPEAAPASPKDLISGLAALDGKQPITPEQAQKWKESLQQLI